VVEGCWGVLLKVTGDASPSEREVEEGLVVRI
jgi:hypothetical protein